MDIKTYHVFILTSKSMFDLSTERYPETVARYYAYVKPEKIPLVMPYTSSYETMANLVLHNPLNALYASEELQQSGRFKDVMKSACAAFMIGREGSLAKSSLSEKNKFVEQVKTILGNESGSFLRVLNKHIELKKPLIQLSKIRSVALVLIRNWDPFKGPVLSVMKHHLQDKELALECLEKNASIFMELDISLQEDPQVALKAVQKDPKNYSKLSLRLKGFPEILKASQESCKSHVDTSLMLWEANRRYEKATAEEKERDPDDDYYQLLMHNPQGIDWLDNSSQ